MARRATSRAPRSSLSWGPAPIACRGHSGLQDPLRARDDYWGKTPQRQCRPRQFRRDRIHPITRTAMSSFEAFRADNTDYWAENEAKRWATAI